MTHFLQTLIQLYVTKIRGDSFIDTIWVLSFNGLIVLILLSNPETNPTRHDVHHGLAPETSEYNTFKGTLQSSVRKFYVSEKVFCLLTHVT